LNSFGRLMSKASITLMPIRFQDFFLATTAKGAALQASYHDACITSMA
jgi:hypothetical protein